MLSGGRRCGCTDHFVLVVDDDADIRETLVDLLELYGYRATGAANGALALEALRAAPAPPCLILLDLMMPVMDGRAFRDELLREPAWAAIPVVLMSAYRDIADQAAAMALEHLEKPLGAAALLETARRYCDCPPAGAPRGGDGGDATRDGDGDGA